MIPGIRGVGKTTLLLQLYFFEKSNFEIKPPDFFEKIFIDVGKLVNEGFLLNDFFNFYEKEKGIIYENCTRKILFILDEVHYDKNWSLTLKNIYDRIKGNKNIIIFATGSSAIKLKLNPDLARRSTTIELYPLVYPEYLEMKYKMKVNEKYSGDISDILIKSKTAIEVFNFLESTKEKFQKIEYNLPPNSINEFFNFGGFPANLIYNQKAYENIKSLIDNVILKDLLTLKRLRVNSYTQVNSLLYLLANSDTTSTGNLKNSIGIKDDRTLINILDGLQDSGLITKVKSYGGVYASARKSPKYFFNSPSLRIGLLDGIIPTGIEGKKLEDYFTLLYHSIFKNLNVRDVNYDVSKGGADFILKNTDESMIIFETGFTKEKTEQINKTKSKVNAKYGILIGSNALEIENNYIIKIPLIYLLML